MEPALARRARVATLLSVVLAMLLVVSGATTVRRVHRALERDALVRLVDATGSPRPASDDRASLLAALAPIGVTRVVVSGHAVTVYGVALPAAERARLAAALQGDGIASVRFVVDPAASQEAVYPDVRVRLERGVLTLTGSVQSDAQHATLVAAGAYAVGAPQVRETLQVTRSGPRDAAVDEHVSALAVLVANLGKATTADVHLRDDGLEVRAEVADDATRSLVAALAAAVGGDGAPVPQQLDIRVDDAARATVGASAGGS